jgi:DNA-binding MarR family transcriptional regulator
VSPAKNRGAVAGHPALAYLNGMSNQNAPTPPTQVIREKFGHLLTDAGWTAIPDMLIKHGVPALGLDVTDLAILLVLFSHWRAQDSKPWPSKGTIAAAIGKDPNTVRRHIQRMQQKGLVARSERRSRTYKNTNVYLLDGVMAKLEPLAAAHIEDRETHKKLQARRARQRGTAIRHKLRIVPVAGVRP